MIAMDVLKEHLYCLKRRERYGVIGNPHEDKVDCSKLPCFRGCRKWCASVMKDREKKLIRNQGYTPDWLLALDSENSQKLPGRVG